MPERDGNNSSGMFEFDEEICVSYLLGELSEDEQGRFETAYFTDDAFFDKFMAVKNELLDLYSRGELNAARHERVRLHFSETAPRRRQLVNSRQFIDAVTRLSTGSRDETSLRLPPRRSGIWVPDFLSLGWTAASVVLLLAVGIWWWSTRQTPERTQDMVAEQSSPQPQISPAIIQNGPTNGDPQANTSTVDGPQPVPTLPSRPIKRPDASSSGLQAKLVLGAIATRDISSSNTVSVYSDTSTIAIELDLAARSVHGYTATVTTVDGKVVWKNNRTQPLGGKVYLKLPAKTLNGSDYILTLSERSRAGVAETVAEYYFHVVRDAQKTPSTVSPK